jgi:hypothetical protein
MRQIEGGLRARTEEEDRRELWPVDAKPRARDRGTRRKTNRICGLVDAAEAWSEEPG